MAGEPSPASRPRVTGTDAAVLAGLAFLLWPAWLLPERYWPALARRLSPLALSDLSRQPKADAIAIRRVLGSRLPDITGEDILRRMAAEGILGFLQVLKSHRPGGWTPRVRTMGAEHVEAALAAGRGAVLWVAHGFHGHLGAKVGFAAAELRVSHLSRATHGFSGSRFGMRALNRIQTIVEDRYIAERLLMPLSGPNAALPLAARRLAGNGVISITAQRGEASVVEAPFLDGGLRLAPGAPALAQATGATLLPAFAFRQADGVIEVTIEPPVGLAPELAREAAIADAVRQYARRLEPYVLRYPGQWLGWLQL